MPPVSCATDYARIFDRYDANPDRHRIAVDAEIALLSQRRTPLRILDLACGTGNWLGVQVRAHGSHGMGWHGLDASPEMLGLARQKVPEAMLVLGRAEELPYDDGEFDFVAVNFAFHHFEQKKRRWMNSRGCWRSADRCG
jgi:ubiquinone/menaquinone biosynthesis C-methylase UbiE